MATYRGGLLSMVLGCFAVAGYLAGGPPAHAQSPLTGQASPDDTPVPVILTISGGVSLGSYQAGVNWALIEAFKRSADPGFRARHGLPAFHLAAMAGASAGNINAFLSGVEWCSHRPAAPVPADSSLFWNVWVRTGWEQIFPEVPYGRTTAVERAVFSREYFSERHFPELARWMTGEGNAPAIRPGCAVPIGVTLSRLTPGEVRIAADLVARTQRYASVLELREVEGRLRFTTPSAAIRGTQHLGEVIFLPPAGSHPGTPFPPVPDSIRSFRVYDLIQASSAFPLAFAPLELEYLDAKLEGCRIQDFEHCRRRAYFADGGLFDNNPLDLAVGIYNIERARLLPDPGVDVALFDDSIRAELRRQGPDAQAELIYINPGQLRGALRSARQDRAPGARGEGTAALLQLFGGAVPAAREYELHSFDRQLARAPETFDRGRIRVTTRSFPIVGEHLGAFAAFLGRPFREFDFHVGVYDALHFLARTSCTSTEEGRAPAPLDPSGEPVLPPALLACLQNRLELLISDPEIDPGAVGRTMTERLYALEFAAMTTEAALRTPEGADERTTLILSLLAPSARLLQPFQNSVCSETEMIRGLLCRDGFARLLREYSTPEVREVVSRYAAHPDCGPEAWRDAPAIGCLADASFHRLLASPEAFTAEAMGRALRQVDRVERILREEGVGDWAHLSSAAEILHRSVLAPRHARGLDLFPSSIPPRAGAGAQIIRMTPSYLAFNFGSSGFEVGYRPTYHLGSSVGVSLTAAPFHWIQRAEDDLDHFRWVLGPNLLFKGGIFLSGLEVGGAVVGRWSRSPFGEEADLVWALPVTAYLLGGKVRIGARILPGNESRVHDQAKLAFTAGPADANGILYWGGRRILRR
jgi:predicted acylesterase/phospholipase RssA